MAAPWRPSYCIFYREVEGAPMTLVVDVGALEGAPWRSHPLRTMATVRLREPDDNGFPSLAESSGTLSDLEDRLSTTLERDLDAWFVACSTWKGFRTFVYYHPRERPRVAVNPAEIVKPYQLTGGDVVDDPDWTYLVRTLAPSTRERWMSRNRQLLRALEVRGDRLDRERLVDHVALFDSEQSAAAAAESLRAHGFNVDEPQTRSDGFAVEFHRTEALSGFRSDEFVLQILDALDEHSGRYDGWSAPIAH